MAGRSIILLVLMLISFHAFSQKMSEAQALQQTYRLSADEKWDSVIIVGLMLCQEGMESSTLYTRIGNAYYQLGQYRSAVPFLFKAYALNSSDQAVLLLLYKSYLYSGNSLQAKYYASKISRNVKKENHISRIRLLESVYLEGGLNYSNNIENNGELAFVPLGMFKIENSQFVLIDDYNYFHAGVQFGITKSISLFASIHQFDIDERLRFVDNMGTYANYDMSSSEIDYYGAFKLRLGQTLSISPAFHWTDYRSQRLVAVGTAPVLPEIQDSIIQNYLASISVIIDQELGTHQFSLSTSNFGNVQQVQASWEMTKYPNYNLDFYFSTGANLLIDGSVIRPSISAKLGGKFTTWFWGESYINIGNLNNVNEQNGYLIYNFPENNRFRFGANAIFPIAKHVEFSLRYQFWLRDLPYSVEQTRRQGQGLEQKSNFTNNTLIGSILWKL